MFRKYVSMEILSTQAGRSLKGDLRMTAISNSEGRKPFDPNQAVNTIETTLGKFLSAADVEAVYGSPVSQGEHTVIPAAEVLSLVGFGLGSGGGSQGAAENDTTGSGSGGGGGGRMLARPVAAIIISPEGVRVEPIVDVTKIALAAFTALGFMAALFNRMRYTTSPNLDIE
jgi:uncharacterized spore protein YtfJ